jgi:uncharacterized lipoprotein YbaY
VHRFTFTRRALTLIAFAAPFLFAACSGMGVSVGGGGLGVSAASSNDEIVKGTIQPAGDAALPEGAVILVNVADVSRADASAEILGGVEIPVDGKEPPFSFVVRVPGSRIRDSMVLALQARIEDADGTLLYISTERVPVITDGAPNEVDVHVDPVRE